MQVDVLTIITRKDWDLFCEEWNVPKSKGITVVMELRSAEMSDISRNCKEVPITDEDLNGDDSECKIDKIPTLRTQPEVSFTSLFIVEKMFLLVIFV